jgi:hypothetical protein
LRRREAAHDADGYTGLCAVKIARLRQRASAVVRDYNRHRHCGSCRKGKRGDTGCRFTVPYAHGIAKSRCIQLGQRRRLEAETDLRLGDVRWCGACVVGGVARKAPFTPAERQRLKAWIKERRLHYEKVDVAAAPSRRSLLAGGDSFAVLQRLLGGDRRCLVVELRRPCPPDGAPSEAPSSVDAVLRLLQGSIDADVSLSTGNFTGEEVTRGLESSDGVDWLLTQCSAAHCDNGIVAQYCGVISAAMECNTAVYHLGAGGSRPGTRSSIWPASSSTPVKCVSKYTSSLQPAS